MCFQSTSGVVLLESINMWTIFLNWGVDSLELSLNAGEDFLVDNGVLALVLDEPLPPFEAFLVFKDNSKLVHDVVFDGSNFLQWEED